MASLQKLESKKTGKNQGSLWKLQFMLDGNRRSMRLGVMSIKNAEDARYHVEHLIECRKHNHPIQVETVTWLKSTTDKIRSKLSSFGLCQEFTNPTIEEFVAAYLESKKTNCNAGTVEQFQYAMNHLTDFFPEDARMCDVSPAKAVQFVDWLSKQSLGKNTARRRIGRIRELFSAAKEQEIVSRNPFKLRSISVSVGAADKQYVPIETIQAVIESIDTKRNGSEWKLLFAFGRYIGCRMPSEIQQLDWSDIDWEGNTILLNAPKTAHQDKPQRRIPIFAAVYPLLRARFEDARDGDVHVFPQLRHNSNPATTASKMVKAASYDVWPNFWNSLRASCETDLMDLHGIRKACQWIGNTPMVAIKHYALMHAGDYEEDGGAKSGAVSASLRVSELATRQKNPGKPGVSVPLATRHGLEP